jgi:hypothetical protein
MQTAGCMMVPSEEDVQKYPVAPNTAMVFLLQDLSACYIKATGSSMLDAPRIQRYIRDDHTNAPVNAQNAPVQKDTIDYAVKADIEKIQKQIDSLNEQVRPLLRNSNNNNRKPEAKNDV